MTLQPPIRTSFYTTAQFITLDKEDKQKDNLANSLQRFINIASGTTKANKKEFEYWISEFSLLRDTITIDKFKCTKRSGCYGFDGF